MTKLYEECSWNNNSKSHEKLADWSFSAHPDNNNILTICRNGISKSVKVKENHEFVYKLQKTQIQGRDGASGVFKFLDDCLSKGFSTCLAWKILNWCFYDCKPA